MATGAAKPNTRRPSRDVQRDSGGAGVRAAPQRPASPLKKAHFLVLLRMDVLPWDEPVARCYGLLWHLLEAQGINLSDLDIMIAAHAVSTNTTLVSRDNAFAAVANRQPDSFLHTHLQLVVW